MTQDMKKTIAAAAKKLILEKPNKKLTVKDIVDECQITRQTFYYHFKDIPELFRWILKQDEENLLHEVESINDTEEALKYFFRLAVNLSCKPITRQTSSLLYMNTFITFSKTDSGNPAAIVITYQKISIFFFNITAMPSLVF